MNREFSPRSGMIQNRLTKNRLTIPPHPLQRKAHISKVVAFSLLVVLTSIISLITIATVTIIIIINIIIII